MILTFQRLIVSPMHDFFKGKNLKTVFGTPFLTEKVILIIVIRPLVSLKNYFSRLFWKIFFFFQKNNIK